MANYPVDASLDRLVEWTGNAVHLRDFAETYGVPNIAKVVKGQYRDVGVSKSVHSELLIHSVQISQKLLAEGVKVKEGKKVIVSGHQHYTIPLTYQGWFELLSQDGKAIKPIASVSELVRAFPSSFIIRENFKAFVAHDTGELKLDKYRMLPSGEQLNLVGEIWVTLNSPKGLVKRRLVHCLDIKGESVYMALEHKGSFSPIAGHSNISGVHMLHGLLEKFRLPIIVRLVHGIIPSKMEKGFTGVFRLNSLYSDESAFVCPLKKDAKMVPISTREPLKLVAANNYGSLMHSEACRYHMERCNNMIGSYLNSIHVLYSVPEPQDIVPKKGDAVRSANGTNQSSAEAIEENILFEEVEDIYAYVREGGPVPQPRPRPLPPAVSVVQKTPSHKASIMQTSASLKRTSVGDREPAAGANNPAPSCAQPMSPPHFTPTKDDFWEEPIYKPLATIRQNKKEKKVEEKIPVPVVINAVREGTPRISHEAARSASPVQNLRQVYKLSHESLTTTSRPNMHSSDDQGDEFEDAIDDYMDAPPVPPKKFTDPETGSTYSDAPHHDVAEHHTHHETHHDERDKANIENTMTFYDDTEYDPVETSMNPLYNTSPRQQGALSGSPVSPSEPTVTVHTPMIARATVHPKPFNRSSSQPHMMPDRQSQNEPYLYTTSVPPAKSGNNIHNGLPRSYSQKIVLNKPKESHLLNRDSNKSMKAPTAVAYSRGGLHRTPINEAPYVAVAHVGETAEGYDMRAISRNDVRRKMNSMYL